MKPVLTMLVVLAVIVIALGVYRGWFTVSNSRAANGDRVNINLTVDEAKMKQDAEMAKEKANEEVKELTGRVK